MVVASFTQPDQEHPAPFPLIPTGIHIATMLAAAYPHLDMVGSHGEERVVFRTSPELFADSIRYTTLGCCLLAAGYYACQFVRALRPLRHEYLGTLGLLQLLYVGLLAGRAWLFPAAAWADLPASAMGLVPAALSLVLAWYDKFDPAICPADVPLDEVMERLAPDSDAAAKAAAKERAVRRAFARTAKRRVAAWLVPTATHAIWLLYAASLNLSYFAPYLASYIPSYEAFAAAAQPVISLAAPVPYRQYVVLLLDLMALLRLAAAVAAVAGRRKGGAGSPSGDKEAKADAKAAEAKSD